MSRLIKHLRKKASWGGFLEEVVEGGIGALPYLIGVPLAGGAAVGYLASKMTSPSDSDREALQERVMDQEVREELGIRQRKLAVLRQRIKEMQARNTPKISRQRDMFV